MLQMTREEARRSLLARQGLIVPFSEPLEAVRAMVAVQTQYAASLEVAVAARLQKGRPGWEIGATDLNGPLVKSWSVRRTLHAHLPEDQALILATVGPSMLRRFQNWRADHPEIDSDALDARILAALAAGPLTREALHAHIPEVKSIPGVGWGFDVMGLSLQGRVIIVGRGASQSFALRPTLEGTHDLAGLFRRYLAAFGPATLADFAFWTGLTQAEAKVAVAKPDGLVPVTVEGLAGTRWDLEEAPVAPEGPLGVRLLAKFDPLILAHRDKSLILPEAMRKSVFRIAAQVEAPVLVNGVVAATWRMERGRNGLNVVIDPCRPLRASEQKRIEAEAARTARRLGTSLNRLHYRGDAEP